jgi:hypothetical protein
LYARAGAVLVRKRRLRHIKRGQAKRKKISRNIDQLTNRETGRKNKEK